jgi:hypothetical protein
MKKIFIFLCLTLLITKQLRSQTFFSILDTLGFSTNYYSNILKKNNNYFLMMSGNSNQGIYKHNFITLNESFEKTNEKLTTYSNIYTTRGSLNFNSDSTKIYSCGFQTYDGNSKGFLRIFNLQGDSLAFFNVGDNTYNWRIIEAIEMPDHTILAVGGRSKYPVGGTNPWDEYPLAMKLDTLGNVLWTKLFTFTDRGLNLGVQQTLDGNYLLNSYTFFNPGTGTGSVYRPTLIKIDSLGNQLWYNRYGGSLQQNSGISGIVEMEDSTLIFEAMLYKYNSILDGEEKYPAIFKTDKNGNVIWQKDYNDGILGYASTGFRLSNNYFYSVGDKGRYGQSGKIAHLRKYDTEGNFIFEYNYEYFNSDTSFNGFLDFTQTPDSGFLCVGYTQYYSTDSIGPYRAWLVKTDKYGCIVQDCQLTGLEDIQELQELSIFPNPSQNVFYINASQEIKNVSVFTINGNRILQENTKSTFAKIDLTDFSSGMYFVEVQTEVGETIRRKVVKAE